MPTPITPHFCGFRGKKDEWQSIITYILLWNYFPTPMIFRRLPAQDTTVAPACPDFSHGNAGKICPSSGNTLMTSLEKHRLAAFVNENKKAQFSHLANSSNNSNSGLGWYFFPKTVVEYLRKHKSCFPGRNPTLLLAGEGEGGHR